MKATKVVSITQDAILDAIRDALRKPAFDDGAMTTDEIVTATLPPGGSRNAQAHRIRDALRGLLASGEWECLRVRRPALGYMASVVGFRPKAR